MLHLEYNPTSLSSIFLPDLAVVPYAQKLGDLAESDAVYKIVVGQMLIIDAFRAEIYELKIDTLKITLSVHKDGTVIPVRIDERGTLETFEPFPEVMMNILMRLSS